MLTIRLFCNQGMSTSLLVNKMREAAAKKEIDVDIVAFPVNEISDRIKGIDCALLGPQVAYMKAKCAEICKEADVPMEVIPMTDYGMCNGEKVLQLALELAAK